MKKHIKYLKSSGACKEAIDYADQYDYLQEAWDNCERGEWMMWLLCYQDGDVNSNYVRAQMLIGEHYIRCKFFTPYTKQDALLFADIIREYFPTIRME